MQEIEERGALDRFRDRAGQLDGMVDRGPNPPDFVITDPGGRRIAVEMTRYHRDSGPRKGSSGAAQESNEQRVMTRAQEVFESKYPGLFVRVSPFFRRVGGSLHRGKLAEYSSRLADLVASMIPPQPSASQPMTQTEARWQQLHAFDLTDVIVHVFVWRTRWMRHGEWDVMAWGTASVDTNHLLSVIRGKEHDLGNYRADYAECWLIVYAMSQSSAFFDIDVLRPQMFTSSFDHVVFLDASQGRFVLVA